MEMVTVMTITNIVGIVTDCFGAHFACYGHFVQAIKAINYIGSRLVLVCMHSKCNWVPVIYIGVCNIT